MSEPLLLDRDPVVIVRDLLISQWDATNIDGSFDAAAWIHTGWYDDSNPNPQISVVFDRESSPWTGIDPGGGGPTAWPEGLIDTDIWVPGDRDRTGVNPKLLRWQLQNEVKRIIGSNFGGTIDSDGNRELESLEVDSSGRRPTPDETPVELRWRLKIRYKYFQGRA